MNFSQTEAQKAVGDLAKQIFKDKVSPDTLKAVEASASGWDEGLWKQLGQAGLLGTAIPEDCGGSGEGFLELCALIEQAGAALAPVPLWPCLTLGALPIATWGTDAQRQRYLPRVAEGTAILTAAIHEPANPDPYAPTTTATRDGASWRITGEKTAVPAAHLADRVLVAARTGDGVALFLVDPHADGVALERQVATTGEPLYQMTLANARVSADDDVIAVDYELYLQHAEAALCAMELGVARRALIMTAKYTSERQQFGKPIGSFQAVGQRAADAYIDVEAIKLTTWEAAWRLSAGLPAADAVARAKYFAAEAGHRVVYAAQHLHGGMGFDLDYPLGRYYTRSKQIELTLGSGTVQLARIGRALAAE